MTTRRDFIQQLLLLASACHADADEQAPTGSQGPVPSTDPPEPSRPDVLFISIDDMNDWPTPFDGPKPTEFLSQISTPNMDRLRDMGTVFQRAYCASPFCGPSRSATLTGLPPHVSGVTQQENILAPRAENGPLLVAPTTTLPRVLKQSGYLTYGAGKIFHGAGYAKYDSPFPACGTDADHEKYDYCAWDHYKFLNRIVPPGVCVGGSKNGDIGDEVQPCPGPFDLATSVLPDARVARYALKRLGEEPSIQPMFLGVGFFKPHKPWQMPQQFYDLYPDAVLANSPDALVEGADQDDLTLTGCVALRDSRQSPSPSTWTATTKDAIRGYLACISFVDHLLGLLLDAVAARSRRTIIVLWSDHGYFMGEKRGWKKPSLYERTTRTPLIIADTAAPVAQSTYSIASLMDLFPTVLDYAGVDKIPKYGVSLRPLVEDATIPWKQTSVVTTFNFSADHQRNMAQNLNADVTRCMANQGIEACPPDIKACATYPNRLAGASFALRTERPGEHYRYIAYYDSKLFWPAGNPGGAIPTAELYDLAADPDERVNLLAGVVAPATLQIAQKLQAELDAKITV